MAAAAEQPDVSGVDRPLDREPATEVIQHNIERLQIAIPDLLNRMTIVYESDSTRKESVSFQLFVDPTTGVIGTIGSLADAAEDEVKRAAIVGVSLTPNGKLSEADYRETDAFPLTQAVAAMITTTIERYNAEQ